jgi:hypothetical protein
LGKRNIDIKKQFLILLGFLELFFIRHKCTMVDVEDKPENAVP